MRLYDIMIIMRKSGIVFKLSMGTEEKVKKQAKHLFKTSEKPKEANI